MTRTSAPQSLLSFARASEPRLREILEEKARAAASLPIDLTPAFLALKEYVLRGGKRLRGALCLLGCAAGGGNESDAFSAAVGLELFHAYLLIHDDFMDRDSERRGGPTLHVALARPGAIAKDLSRSDRSDRSDPAERSDRSHRADPSIADPSIADRSVAAKTAGEHGAGSLAILFGSLCQAWALEEILAANVPADRALAAGQLVSRALAEVTLGQALDIAAPLSPELPRSAALRIEEMKTGSYTFELPLLLGATLAGANRDTRAALSAYAQPLGKAFQIADDLLGTFGAPEQTGKSAGNDLREGKRTLMVLRALEIASAEDQKILRAGLGDRGLGEAKLEELREILRRAGAEKFARDEAERLCSEAELALSSAAIPRAVAEELRAIARYAVRRET